ncbi:MAG: glycosyltransferase family 39 protein, partial [Acidobacteriota bacterium]|nr:glycosyltransferase family 39 protein [Acidobacteriota bacterium]
MPPAASSRITLAAAATLLGIYLLQGVWAAALKSPTFDETGDIAAGLSYVQNLDVRANLQHPPLMKELAGIALYLGGVRLVPSPAVHRMLSGGGGEREAGSELLAANGVARTLLLARIPYLLCSALLGLLIFLWGRELAGDAAAIFALALYTLDPNAMAHGYLVTMDQGLAAFATFFFYTLWRYIRRPDTRRLAVCGVAMGLMLAAKFSAVFLLPAAALLGWFYTPRGTRVRTFLIAGALAAVVVQAVYLSPGGLYLYRAGIGLVNADHNPDYKVYLAGQL